MIWSKVDKSPHGRISAMSAQPLVDSLTLIRINVVGDFPGFGNFWPVAQVIFDNGSENRRLRPWQNPTHDPHYWKERDMQTQGNEKALHEGNLLDKPRANLRATDELIANAVILRA